MDLLKLDLANAGRGADALRSQVNIARAVLHHRLENDLSQADLARKAQTTQARVSEVEAMKGDPKLSTLSRIAASVGCMIDMVPIAPPSELTTKADAFFDLDILYAATDRVTGFTVTDFVYASATFENTVQMAEKAAA